MTFSGKSGSHPSSLDKEEDDAFLTRYLQESYNDSEVRARLMTLAQDASNSRKQWSAVLCLCVSDLTETETNRSSFCPYFLKIAQTPEHIGYESAVVFLKNWSGTWNSRDYSELRQDLLKIARHPEHPLQWWVIKRLWDPKNEGELSFEDRLLLSSALFAVAQNEEHDERWYAIWSLWDWECPLQTGYQEMLRPTLFNVAQNPQHQEHLNAIWSLWDTPGDHQEKDRLLLHPELLRVAENPNHPRRWDAIVALWEWKSIHQEEDQAKFRLVLRERALKHDNPLSRAQAIDCLKQSENPRDQNFIARLSQLSGEM